MKFKQRYLYEERVKESTRVRTKYPDRVPVICEKTARSSMSEIDKNKYLVPMDLTIGQFVYVVRKRLKLPSEKAIFLFVGGTMKSTSTQLQEAYDEHKDNDGFLYVTYSDENVFGWFSQSVFVYNDREIQRFL